MPDIFMRRNNDCALRAAHPHANVAGRERLLLYRPDGILEERTVTTGLANWDHTEIISGLKDGDQIVVSLDQAGVKAGVRVQPEVGKLVK